MSCGEIRLSRRRMLGCGIRWFGGLMLTMLIPLNALLAGKAQKTDFLYQDHPHDGESCAQCKNFLPGNANDSTGTCAIVEGVISRNGWCTAYSPKD